MDVTISIESKRWCGFRSPSAGGVGIYMIGLGTFEPCERLPFPLLACPCCGAGIKQSRGYTVIDPTRLFDPFAHTLGCTQCLGIPLEKDDEHDHALCLMCNPIGTAGENAGLIWVGEKFYRTARDFMIEAQQMGISRKLGALPLDFEVGKTAIYLAHKKTSFTFNDATKELEWVQGVFSAFIPIRVDLVIEDPDQVPAKALELAKRLEGHCRIVKVIPDRDHDDDRNGDDW